MTHRWPFLRPSALLAPAVALAVLGLSACSDPAGPSSGQRSVGDLSPALSVTPSPGLVTVCKVVTSGSSGPYDFTVAQTVPTDGYAGTLDQGTSFSLSDGDCTTVWTAAATPARSLDPPVTVTVDEVNMPSGMQFDSAIVVTPFTANPTSFTDPEAWLQANLYHGGVITFYNSEVPPPPPVTCAGLTPGFWKNWSNHYTAAEFESLLSGTIASSIADAESILDPADPKDPIAKLAKFVLANQLTLNLTGTDLPNPSGGSLTGSCTAPDTSSDLGSALSTALDMLANPGNYTKAEILAVKDVLDAIANLGGG